MIKPPFLIRDAQESDMPTINYLFASQDFPDAPGPEGIRVAIGDGNVMFGAIRIEHAPDGSDNINPVVVFGVKQGLGVGKALVVDALKKHPDLRLVARGHSVGFYEALGFVRCGWEDIDPRYRTDCDMCPMLGTCGPVPFKSVPARHVLTFLGTSSGCGVPAFFCHCPACEEARRDPSKRRGCTGVVIQGNGTMLIDTPPDVRQALIREGFDTIDELFLTHAHYDHLGGLGELEYFIRLCREDTLPFRGSSHALAEALQEFSYMDDCFELDAIDDYATRSFDGMTIQALPLNHCPGAFGYLITTPNGHRTFYAPDTAELKPEVVEILKGVDTLIMDATFWKNVGVHKTHHTVHQTVDEGINLLGAGKVILQHLAPHMCDEGVNEIHEIYQYAAQFGERVAVAEDGMKVEL